MKWQASAPSNIALIKYMGKIPNRGNISTNSSVSYTLEHLRTFIEIEVLSEGKDRWEPLALAGREKVEISQSGQDRFLKHLAFLKKTWNYEGAFLVRSNNNFPSDCGLASSASSFAALTHCAYLAIRDLRKNPSLDYTMEALADLSRQGSGSSCRSFFSPWGLWDEKGSREIDLPFKKLHHQVIVVNDKIKKVSSSEAHKRISSSLLSEGRVSRAESRLESLKKSMTLMDWRTSFETIWSEFWDMHALFETSVPSFGYMSQGSLKVLDVIKDVWQRNNDGPWVTMDAGPNVHLLYREDQILLAKTIESELAKEFQVISHYI